jgi:hypothetical protein
VENAAQERIAADRNSKSNSVSAVHPEVVRGSVPSNFTTLLGTQVAANISSLKIAGSLIIP